MKKLRILLADDHEVMRHGLKLLVDAQPDMQVIGEARDGSETLIKAKELSPDIVVMDLFMPGIDGAQATEMLRESCPQIKVLALTAHQNEAVLRQLLKAGASGYVVKQATAEELTKAIRSVGAGGIYLDPLLAGKAITYYAEKADQEIKLGDVQLSQREKEVMELIAWGYTNKEIAAKLFLSVNTVETYKGRIMEKLNLHSRADIVKYALRQGWLRAT